eukprot:gnl/MRDRNA2_/MRDRNA2_99619_c0_seq1.p1 gnl/MRDRNA2_/MRDRNA2_99619_c0~~gnl/MRDRNA2_/MRDRNA2_99619_c0_seq1.p1  ORF type:complete len:306 (+),score=63.31 gnl/MRDRNA2_/MRDRNA2_99619_c0_seq1:84-1001(+)
MPHWNLRATAQVSHPMDADPILMPAQISALDTALRHIGYHETLMPSFLQTSTTTLQNAQEEWLLFGLVGMISTVLLVAGFAIWLRDYETAKLARFDRKEERTNSKASKQRQKYTEVKKASEATRLFPSYMVGNDFVVKGTLTSKAEDVLIEVKDDQDKAVLRAYVCETGQDPGILIEDAFNTPLAFIDTSSFVNTERSPALEIHKLGEHAGLFGTIKKEENLKNNVGHLVVRNASHRIVLALQPDSSGRSMNAVDERSRLVGTAQNKNGAWKVLLAPGVDAGMMLCGVLGIAKIGSLAQSTGGDD